MSKDITCYDLILKNATIITMDQNDEIIDNGILGIKDGAIELLAQKEKVNLDSINTDKEIDLEGKYIFPGLINTHSHAFQILLKGIGADLKLMDWVMAVVAPYGDKITREINYLAAQLMALESLQSGCTTVADFFYAHHQPELSDGVIEGLMDAGIRGLMIRNFHDCGIENGIPESYIEKPEEAFNDVLRLKKKYEINSDEMLKVWTGPGVTWGISKEALEATAEFSKAENIPYSTHILETKDDNNHTQKLYGKNAIDLMDEVGFLNSNLLAAHCVKLSDSEINLLGKRKVNIAHNAVCNMYLGSGIAPIVELKKAGAKISLGSDGAASNNSMDMIETMKTTALLQKVAHEKPDIITAEEVLKMSTTEAAETIHMNNIIGSLEEGKKADLFVFNPEDPKSFPVHDPIATLLYSSSIKNVEKTIVNGKILYDDGEYLNNLNKSEIFRKVDNILSDLIV